MEVRIVQNGQQRAAETGGCLHARHDRTTVERKPAEQSEHGTHVKERRAKGDDGVHDGHQHDTVSNMVVEDQTKDNEPDGKQKCAQNKNVLWSTVVVDETEGEGEVSDHDTHCGDRRDIGLRVFVHVRHLRGEQRIRVQG